MRNLKTKQHKNSSDSLRQEGLYKAVKEAIETVQSQLGEASFVRGNTSINKEKLEYPAITNFGTERKFGKFDNKFGNSGEEGDRVLFKRLSKKGSCLW